MTVSVQGGGLQYLQLTRQKMRVVDGCVAANQLRRGRRDFRLVWQAVVVAACFLVAAVQVRVVLGEVCVGVECVLSLVCVGCGLGQCGVMVLFRSVVCA